MRGTGAPSWPTVSSGSGRYRRLLLYDHLPTEHLFPALIAQGSLLACRQVDPNRLIEGKRIPLVQAGEQDFLRAGLVRLPGHDERDRLPRGDLHVRGLKTLLRHIHMNFRRLTGRTLLASDRQQDPDGADEERSRAVDRNLLHDIPPVWMFRGACPAMGSGRSRPFHQAKIAGYTSNSSTNEVMTPPTIGAAIRFIASAPAP